MLTAFPGARVALLNSGAVRKDLKPGRVSVGDVMEVLPFANTLVLLDLTGTELKAALEEYVAFLLQRYPAHAVPPTPYVAGISFSVRTGAPAGQRICGLSVRDASGTYMPMEPRAVYRTVVNAFMAGGGDHFKTLKAARAFRVDTGVIDQEVFRNHLKGLGSFGNPTDRRITILP